MEVIGKDATGCSGRQRIGRDRNRPDRKCRNGLDRIGPEWSRKEWTGCNGKGRLGEDAKGTDWL